MLISERIRVCELEEMHVPDWTWHEGESRELHSSKERNSRLAGNHFDCDDTWSRPRADASASREATSPSSTIAHVGSGETRSDIDRPAVGSRGDQSVSHPSARHVCPTSGEPHRIQDDDRNHGLHALVHTLQVQPVSEANPFALHIRVGGFSGDFGPSPGSVARVWGRSARLGEAILGRLWRTQNRGGSSRQLLCRTILHQDPRYFPSRKRNLISRSWYAATRVVITRNDRGDNTFNTSEFLGTLFTSSLQNSYYPRRERNFGEP